MMYLAGDSDEYFIDLKPFRHIPSHFPVMAAGYTRGYNWWPWRLVPTSVSVLSHRASATVWIREPPGLDDGDLGGSDFRLANEPR